MPDIPFIIETKAKSSPLSSHPQPSKKNPKNTPNPKSTLISALASHPRVVNSGAKSQRLM